MDARNLNKVLTPFKYLLPVISEIFAAMRGSKLFTELDLMNAFHQILLTQASRKYTAFTDPKDNTRYQWTRMFFGDAGTASKMQCVMEKVLRIGSPEALLHRVYVDNVLIFHKTGDISKHAQQVKEAMELLTAHHLKIRPDKCKFAFKKLQTLGHLISKDDLSVDPIKAAAFIQFKVPKTGKQLEHLLGFVNYIRDYIPSYSTLLSP
jgi:Reverse transcriptase (RNA-dependent DNA polymerase)